MLPEGWLLDKNINDGDSVRGHDELVQDRPMKAREPPAPPPRDGKRSAKAVNRTSARKTSSPTSRKTSSKAAKKKSSGPRRAKQQPVDRRPSAEEPSAKDLRTEASEFGDSRPFFRSSTTEVPDRFLPVVSEIVILDQGAEGSGVGFALAGLINLLRSERGERDLVSPRMLYEMAKQYAGLPRDTEGAYLWSGFFGWHRHGVCPEALWPYEPGELGTFSDAAREAAATVKPVNIERVRLDENDVRAAVYERHAVIAAAKIHDGWQKAVGANARIDVGEPASFSGVQPVVVIGYTEDGFLVQNSWGSAWGGVEIDGVGYAGCAIWSYRDFAANAVEAWTAEIEGDVLPERFREKRSPRAGYLPDSVEGRDRLDIGREVESLAMVIASRDVEPPLAIGLFGDWGVGKSFFINELHKRLDGLTTEAKRIEKVHDDSLRPPAAGGNTQMAAQAIEDREEHLREPAFWSDIAQIDFNAWHYADQNLWASIVVRIFDGLAEYLIERRGGGLLHEEREAILKRIEEANDEIRNLEAKLKEVDGLALSAENDLKQNEAEIAKKEQELEGLDFGAIALRTWKEQITTNETVRKTLSDLGVPTALSSIEELRTALEDARSEAGATRARFVALTTEGSAAKRLLLLIGILIAGSLIGLAVDYAAGTGFWSDAAGTLASAVSWASAGSAALAKLLEGVNGRIRETRDKLNDIVKTETATERAAREELKQELVDLATRRKTIADGLAAQQARRKSLDDELADLRIGRRLFNFIEERAKTAEYRDKLGIIARIREDFDTLSSLLAENSAEKRKRWLDDGDQAQTGGTPPEASSAASETARVFSEPSPTAVSDAAQEDAQGQDEDDRTPPVDDAGVASIDRIVLYIDDLDRCAPERVVEVLQAIHLLLALKLFVVVVAVDSRWLLRSLEKEYPEFLSLDHELLGERELVRRASTPQNYLEKIFQIALTIKPMRESGYIQLVDDLVGPTVAVLDEDTTHGDKQGADDELALAAVKKPEGVDGKSDRGPVRKVNPNPPSLEITPREVQLMHDLYPFIGTPRTVKRFVNTYRLIRASLSPKELHDYETEDSHDPVAVLVLLALMTGAPMEAPWLFEALDAASSEDRWDLFVKGLEPIERTRSRSGLRERVLVNSVCPAIQPDAAPRWERLHESLAEYEHVAFETLAPLRRWVSRVARCSFYPFSLQNSRTGDV